MKNDTQANVVQKKPRAALYVRLSREDGDPRQSESNSISNQKLLLTTYAKEHDLEVFSIYSDDDYSGVAFDNRPGFSKLKMDIENGLIDVVLTKDLSRFGRNYSEMGYYLDVYFKIHDVRFIAVTDNVDTAIESSCDIAPFMNLLNDYYCRDISRKVRSVIQANAKSGKFMGSKMPYGYKRSIEDRHKMTIDPPAADIVSEIFKLFAEGISARSIATGLNNKGILTPYLYAEKQAGKSIDEHSKKWNSNTVLQLLKNDAYIGNITQCKRKVQSYKVKRRVPVPQSEWITVRNVHDPIVDIEVWNRVQKRFNERIKTRTSASDNLFSGLLRCSDCHGAMVLTSHKTKETIRIRYRCTKYSMNGKDICSAHTIEQHILYELVYNDIANLAKQCCADPVGMVNKIDKFKGEEYHKAQKRIAAQLNKAQKSLQKLQGLSKRVFEKNASGEIPDSILHSLLHEYDSEMTEIRQEIDSLNEQSYEVRCKIDTINRFVELMQSFKKMTRSFLVSVIDHVVVYSKKDSDHGKKRIVIVYKGVGRLNL